MNRENGQMRKVSMTIEALYKSITSCLMNFPHYLDSNVNFLLVLAEWCLPDLPLAIVYELDYRVRSNHKMKYFTMYRSN